MGQLQNQENAVEAVGISFMDKIDPAEGKGK